MLHHHPILLHHQHPVVHHQDASTQDDMDRDNTASRMRTLSSTIPENLQAKVVSELGQSLAPSSVTVLQEFIGQPLSAMQRLQAGRSNVLAGLAKALGTMREDGTNSRMPVGLIEYARSFFGSDTMTKINQITQI